MNKSNDSEQAHNFEWINANRVKAYSFAAINDPWRMPEFQHNYDRAIRDALKITAYETRIEFVISRALNSTKPSGAYPLGYEYDPIKYDGILQKTYDHFLKLL